MTSDRAPLPLGIVGARGYVGAELLRLLAGHPQLRPGFVVSRGLAGERVEDHIDGASAPGLRFEELDPAEVAARDVAAYVLALPNGQASDHVAAISARRPDAVILDLSADHRFTAGWCYGLPERTRSRLRGATRIANPGCYATGAQLAIAPALELLDGPPVIFGVSGYSGAGATPSPRNDLARLRDNLLPYALTGHVHELEVSHHLDRPVRFSPHVAPFFRGITLTVSLPLARPTTRDELRARYDAAYRDEPLVRVQTEIPEVRDAAHQDHVTLGGVDVDARDGRRGVLVATLDNLRKGAASQALQNLNLALGLDELAGLTVPA
ncbi:MAG: N-acetyl-gamma-glutamyl-phosphate reductase [Myxococcales bacterium]|nr:N-acetyl-gamma-glutamyl-phosphate reductase [Myxococcales bacterium]